MCGNYLKALKSPKKPMGSPPRVRELLVCQLVHDGLEGITPACAGITFADRHKRRHYRDHPRVCGNYNINAEIVTEIMGSPPRVRELHTVIFLWALPHGITPACAGITNFVHCIIIQCRDHPRVCGNYTGLPVACRQSRGSPPRVRELRL